MRMTICRYFTFLLFILLISQNLKAQVRITSYINAGESNVSEGLYIGAAFLGAYSIDNIMIEAGSQFDIKNAGSNFYTGTSLKVSRDFSIKDFQFEVQGLFLYHTFSDLIHELNRGILAGIERRHFCFKLGTEFRSYHITKKAGEKYEIDSNKKLHENWNLMYLIGYNLKPEDHLWNIGVSLSNIDHFIINQETNPMFYLKGHYKVSHSLELFTESWYKSAGTFNISAEYFGFFIRSGLIWKINTKK